MTEIPKQKQLTNYFFSTITMIVNTIHYPSKSNVFMTSIVKTKIVILYYSKDVNHSLDMVLILTKNKNIIQFKRIF